MPDSLRERLGRLEESPRSLLLLLVGLTLLARLVALLFSAVISADGVRYIEMARAVARGDWSAIQSQGFFTLYPFLIALFRILIPDWELAGRSVSLVLGSSAVIPLFLLARRFVGLRPAIVAALLYAFHPRFVEFGCDVLREGSLWCFSLFSLWLCREALFPGRWGLMIPAALSASLAVFTRMEGVIVVVVAVSWIIWFVWAAEGRAAKAILLTLLFLTSIPVVSSPALVLIKQKVGRWEAGQAVTKLPQMMTRERPGDRASVTGRTGVTGIDGFLATALRHRYAVYGADVTAKFVKALGAITLPFFLAGLFVRRTSYTSGDAALFLWIFFFAIGSLSYGLKEGYFGTRHALSMVLPALIWGGRGFWELEGRIRGYVARRRPAASSTFVPATILFAVLFLLLPQALSSNRADKAELKTAGLYLKAGGYSGQRFAAESRLYRVGFYGDLDLTLIPDGLSFEEALRLAREDRRRFFLIDERTTAYSAEERRRSEETGAVVRIPCPSMDNLRDYSMVIYHIVSR